MITQRNINEAEAAYKEAQSNLDRAKLDRDAFKAYIDDINAGKWAANVVQIPSKGPLTKSQAAMIHVNIPEDYSMPAVFAKEEIWHLAGTQYVELEKEIKDFDQKAQQAKKTLTELQDEYTEELDRAAELAAKDPSVIAAKNNAEAERIKSETELERMENESRTRRENMRMLMGGLFGIMVIAVVLIIVSKALRS